MWLGQNRMGKVSEVDIAGGDGGAKWQNPYTGDVYEVCILSDLRIIPIRLLLPFPTNVVGFCLPSLGVL